MKDWFRERFHGLYWRQMAVTVGMVFLTLVLLGVSFFSLSYSYARGQKTDELMVRAMAVSKLSVRYLETGRYLSMEELQKDEQFRQLAATAAVISEMDILVCDMDGHVLLSTDATMEGRPVTIPSSVMDKVSADGTWAGRSRLDQIYSSKQFVGGVSVVNPTTGEVLGAVFTVCASDSVDNLWRAFAGLLMMTGFVVLMISFMASSITTMRQIKPIREMAAATRQYADGDFDVRMNDYGREDEIGELAASFNNMAESLQQTERQRREFIANISHELKTPMTTIAGYTDGILDGTIPPENEKQYLRIIANESRRLSRLVRRMLDVSQLQAIDPLRNGNHFDVCESMRRVLISMEKKINDRHLDVEADIPDEPILVLGDKIVEKTSFQVKLPATPIASQRLSGTTFVNGRVRGRISGFVDAEIHGVVKGDISAIMSSGSYDLPEGSGQPPEAGASPEDTPNTPPADSVTGKEGDAQ